MDQSRHCNVDAGPRGKPKKNKHKEPSINRQTFYGPRESVGEGVPGRKIDGPLPSWNPSALRGSGVKKGGQQKKKGETGGVRKDAEKEEKKERNRHGKPHFPIGNVGRRNGGG